MGKKSTNIIVRKMSKVDSEIEILPQSDSTQSSGSDEILHFASREAYDEYIETLENQLESTDPQQPQHLELRKKISQTKIAHIKNSIDDIMIQQKEINQLLSQYQLTKDQFEQKTVIKYDRDNADPNFQVLSKGKNYFGDKISYQNPSHSQEKQTKITLTKKNKIPSELLSRIN